MIPATFGVPRRQWPAEKPRIFPQQQVTLNRKPAR
jgi:hypothetical protein